MTQGLRGDVAKQTGKPPSRFGPFFTENRRTRALQNRLRYLKMEERSSHPAVALSEETFVDSQRNDASSSSGFTETKPGK